MRYALTLALIATFSLPAFSADPKPKMDDWGEMDEAVQTANTDAKQAKAPNITPEKKEALQKDRADQLDKIDTIGDKHADDPKAQTKVAEAFLDVDEPKRALSRADKAVELAPQDPNARVIHGQANFKLGRYEEAAQDAKRVLKTDPHNPAALALYNLTRGRTGGSSGAATAQENQAASSPDAAAQPKASQLAPNPASAQARAAIQSQAQATAASLKVDGLIREAAGKSGLGDHQSAKELLDKAILLEPQNAKAHLERAKVNLALKQGAAALKDADEAHQWNPNSAEVYLVRAQAKEALGLQVEGILADYQQAAEMDPSFTPMYQDFLARYKSGKSNAASDHVGQDQQASGPAAGGNAASVGLSPMNLIFGKLPEDTRRRAALVLVIVSFLVVWIVGAKFQRKGP